MPNLQACDISPWVGSSYPRYFIGVASRGFHVHTLRALDDIKISYDCAGGPDPDQLRELCERAGLPESITKDAMKDLWDA